MTEVLGYENADPSLDYRATYIWFRHRATGPRTKVWTVLTKKADEYLGTVVWDRGWRQYVFQAEQRTAWEEDCLRDLADFLEARTKEHRASRKRDTRIGS